MNGGRPASFGAVLLVLAAVRMAAAVEPPGPLSPEASQACFEVVPGHTVELVAAEPLVFDPVAVCWDDAGRLFVAEMSDYPNGDGGGRIATLSDADGDGRIDTRTLFAAGLPFPNGLLPWKDGLLVTAAPDILFLADRDGDGAAETREVILTGFNAGNQQLRVNGLTLGPDGWVYAANGRNGGVVTSPRRPDAPAVSIDRHDLRFDPDTGVVEPVAGFSQFGLAFDGQGNRFSNWNTAPIRHVVFPLDVAARHPLSAPPSDMENLEDPLQQNRVFPASASPTTFNREPTDAFNASCGLSIDRGSLLFPSGCAYVCEPLLNIVHRRELVPRGATFEARRPAGEETREFLASRDSWFRPVFTATGPDGALWICDFYRRWVEHPDFVKADLREGIDWDEGNDRGRIWRVRPTGTAQPIGDRAAGRKGDGPESPPVARQRLASAGDDLAAVAASLAAAPDPAVRFHVALAAERLDPSARASVLATILATEPHDPWVDAAASCIAEEAGPALVGLLVAGRHPPRAAILHGLAVGSGRRDADHAPLSDVVAGLEAGDPSALTLVAGFVAGRRSIGVEAPLESFGGRPLQGWLDEARAAVGEPASSEAALTLLALDRSDEATAILVRRLAEPMGSEEVTVLLRALRGREPLTVTEGILAAWPTASPAVRRAMIEAMSLTGGFSAGLPLLATAIEAGDVAPGDLDPDARRHLLACDSVDPDLRDRLSRLLGGAASPDRAAVVTMVERALPDDGDRQRGGALFAKHCAGCHRSAGVGARVGPDLAAMHTKPRGQILEDILDPNRRLTGEYAAVAIVTKDGESFTGLVSGESPAAVILTIAEGKTASIPRRTIEALRGTGRSLMPEGFEQALSPADFADLLAFLRQGGKENHDRMPRR